MRAPGAAAALGLLLLAATASAPAATAQPAPLVPATTVPAATAAASGAQAAPASSALPDCVRRLGTGARPLGQGTLRWFGLSVYQAQLWVGAQGFDAETLGSQPFALRLRYLRSLRGADIARRSDELMHDMHRDLDPTTRAAWLSAMLRLFPDVHDGDTLCGVYLPRTDTAARTEFLDGDQLLGSIPGEAFARAFFGIWLSPRSPQPGLRAELLAGAGH